MAAKRFACSTKELFCGVEDDEGGSATCGAMIRKNFEKTILTASDGDELVEDRKY